MTVTQHHNRVANLRNLVEVVADKEHPDATRTKLSNHTKQVVCFMACERGRRFVKDQNPCVDAERFCYLNQLLASNPQITDQSIDVDIETDTAQSIACLRPEGFSIYHSKSRWNPSHHDVLSDAQRLDKIEFLVNGRNTEFFSRVSVRQADCYPVDENATPVGLINAGHHLDQCRFSGTIFTKKDLYFSGAYIDSNVGDYLNCSEGFADSFKRDQWCLDHVSCSHEVLRSSGGLRGRMTPG